MVAIAFFIGLFLGGVLVYFSALENYHKAKFFKNKYYEMSLNYEELLYKYDLLQESVSGYEKRFGVKL